jgi:hypothetical protein
VLDIIIEKIEKIQNKQRSLQWGHYQMSDTEIMFAVGNKAYPKEPHYFIVTSDCVVFLLDDTHKQNVHKKCSDVTEVTNGVISLLKEWFPAK